MGLTVLPVLVDCGLLARKQRADPLLGELSEADGKSAAIGYLCQDELLVRKWNPRGVNCVGDPVFQVVAPSKIREECDILLSLTLNKSKEKRPQKNINMGKKT